MSKAPSLTADPPERPDPVNIVEENRDLFERIAASNLKCAEYFERALQRADGHQEEDDG